MYKIDKGIEIPTRKDSKYPWHQMDVGDSFFVPQKNGKPSIINVRGALRKSGFRITRRRSVEGGVEGLRIWRIK